MDIDTRIANVRIGMAATAQAAGLLSAAGAFSTMAAGGSSAGAPVPPPIAVMRPMQIRNYGFRSVVANGTACKPFSTTTIQVPLPSIVVVGNQTVHVALMDDAAHVVGKSSMFSNSMTQGKGVAWKQIVRSTPHTSLIKVWDAVYGMPWFCIAGSIMALVIIATIIGIIKAAL